MPNNYTKWTACSEHETVVKYVDETKVIYYCFDCDANHARTLNEIRDTLGLHPTEIKPSFVAETPTVEPNTNENTTPTNYQP